MIQKQVLKVIRTMKRKNQDFRLIEGKGCVRRIDLDDNMRQRIADSFQRVLDWQGNNVRLFGVDLVWEGFVSEGHDQDRHFHYLVVTLQGFTPGSAEEFDRVFFKGLQPDNGHCALQQDLTHLGDIDRGDLACRAEAGYAMAGGASP